MSTRTIFCLYSSLILHVYSINCITLESSMSEVTNNVITSVSCPASLTLVSCGFRTQQNNDLQIRGSYIINQICYAMNGASGNSNGVYAYARCCDPSPYLLSCNTYISEYSGTSDDAKVNVTCINQSLDHETLFGCTAHGDNGDLVDGSFPGTFPDNNKGNPVGGTFYSYGNTCSGWNAQGSFEGVRSFGTCCESDELTFDCVSIISAEKVSGVGATITISCPAKEYFMTSCSATSNWHEQNQWFVSNDSQCEVRNGASHDGLKAAAICCKEITSTPTAIPTYNPTVYPTYYPTIYPTRHQYHTTYPTSNPASTPTTSNPTLLPTSNPSNVPTKSPTFLPSFFPTKLPTKSPINSGQIGDVSTTLFGNSKDELNDESGISNSFITNTIQLLIYIIAGFGVITVILCFVICWRHKRKKKMELQRIVSSVSSTDIETCANVDTNTNTNNTNYNGEDATKTAIAMEIPITNNESFLNKGETEMNQMIELEQNNTIAKNVQNESESEKSESDGLYTKKEAHTRGNDVDGIGTPIDNVTAGYLAGDNDANLIADNENSDTCENGNLYDLGTNVTTKGDA